jgi:hypothetical protein
MIFEIVELKKNRKYTFVIGTRAKPDNYLRARIRNQIDRAMSYLGREPDSYAVSIVRNEEEESGEKPLPPLQMGRDYLIFAILFSGDSAESFSEKELEEQREEVARGIFAPKNSRVALVLLRDALVNIITTEEPSSPRVLWV